MKSGYIIYALICLQLLSTNGQEENRSCSCVDAECDFKNVFCAPHDNNCNKENVALGKPTKYSTLFSAFEFRPIARPAAGCLAVNGNTATNFFRSSKVRTGWNCHHSDDGDTAAYWEVDLGKDYMVREITIFGRELYNQRMLNITVSVNDVECYRYPTTDPDTILVRTDITCTPPLKGSRVKLFKPYIPPPPRGTDAKYHQYHLNICEVQVWVCKTGFYGDKCSKVCNSKCLNCDNYDGTCRGGCTSGAHGTYCSSNCGKCEGISCFQNNGSCVSGKCQNGWTGGRCELACDSGWFGVNCASKCGTCAGSKQCSRVDGSCSDGCDPGWMGTLCNEACKAGTWGLNCRETCGNCLNRSSCVPHSGQCTQGCETGWMPDTCTSACEAGKYGVDCSSACGNCKKGTTCNVQTGDCPEGCEDGWISAKCNEQCPENSFGPGCNTKCGKCFNNLQCYVTTGECPLGCTDGWTNLFCNESCPLGTFGKNCSSACSTNCKDNVCHTENGACTKGCVSGFKGSSCNETEEVTTTASTSSSTIIVVGALAGALLLSIVLILIVWCRKKQIEEQAPLTESPKEFEPVEKKCFTAGMDNQVANVTDQTATEAKAVTESSPRPPGQETVEEQEEQKVTSSVGRGSQSGDSERTLTIGQESQGESLLESEDEE